MLQAEPYPTIAAVGPQIGKLIEGQIEVAFRRFIHGPHVHMEDRFVRLLTGENHPLGNFALVRDPNELSPTAEAIDPLVAAGKPSAAIYSDGSVGQHVDSHLRSRGFELHEIMTAMAVELDKLTETALPQGYEFVRVDEARSGEQWAASMGLGYEIPLEVARAFTPKQATDDVQCFAILKDSKIVCTSLLFLSDGFAGIYCVSTVPTERGKGLGAHATAQALRIAREHDYHVGILQATEMGKPVYQRLGFVEFGGVPVYVRTPEA